MIKRTRRIQCKAWINRHVFVNIDFLHHLMWIDMLQIEHRDRMSTSLEISIYFSRILFKNLLWIEIAQQISSRTNSFPSFSFLGMQTQTVQWRWRKYWDPTTHLEKFFFSMGIVCKESQFPVFLFQNLLNLNRKLFADHFEESFEVTSWHKYKYKRKLLFHHRKIIKCGSHSWLMLMKLNHAMQITSLFPTVFATRVGFQPQISIFLSVCLLWSRI